MRWNRVGQGPGNILTSADVLVRREVSVEKLVGFPDWNLDREPVASRSHIGRCYIVLRKPLVDGLDSLLLGRDKLVDLHEREREHEAVSCFQLVSTNLGYRQVLPVFWAAGLTDRHECIYETVRVTPSQRNTELERGVGRCSASLGETCGNRRERFVHLHGTTNEGVTECEGEERGEEELCRQHLA